MNVWKQFCRAIESKIVRRHFGNLVPLIETCAVFEFTAEQIEKAQAYEPPLDDEHPIPPFPFPHICCVGPGGVIVLRDPVMNTETGVLEFETIISQPDFFQTATCTVDSTASGKFDVATHNVRGVLKGRYFDEDNPYSKIEVDEIRRIRETNEGLRNRAAELRAKADANGGVVDLQSHEDVIASLIKQVEDHDAGLVELGEKFGHASVDAVRKGFDLGLREVQWINKPDHFTVEVGPADPPQRRKTKDGRARRIGERSRFIVLTKNEIAEAWHRTHRGGTHASPVPHLRRGHYRTIDAAKATGPRRVWVRAAHVNGECVEWRDGDRRYKVR